MENFVILSGNCSPFEVERKRDRGQAWKPSFQADISKLLVDYSPTLDLGGGWPSYGVMDV